MITDDKFIRQSFEEPEAPQYDKQDLQGIADKYWDLNKISREKVPSDDPLPFGTEVEFTIQDGTILRGKVASKSGNEYVVEVSKGECFLIPPGKLEKVSTTKNEIQEAISRYIKPRIEVVTQPTIEMFNRVAVRISYRDKRPNDDELIKWAQEYNSDWKLVDAIPGNNREIGLVFEVEASLDSDIEAAEDTKPQGGDQQTRGEPLSSEEIEGTGRIADITLNDTLFNRYLKTAESLSKAGAWICGGAVRDLYLNEIPNDIDVFIPENETSNWFSHLREAGFEQNKRKFHLDGVTVDVVSTKHSSPREIVANFDCNTCQWWMDTNGNFVPLDKSVQLSTDLKEAYFKFNKDLFGSSKRRANKLKSRGWTIIAQGNWSEHDFMDENFAREAYEALGYDDDLVDELMDKYDDSYDSYTDVWIYEFNLDEDKSVKDVYGDDVILNKGPHRITVESRYGYVDAWIDDSHQIIGRDATAKRYSPRVDRSRLEAVKQKVEEWLNNNINLDVIQSTDPAIAEEPCPTCNLSGVGQTVMKDVGQPCWRCGTDSTQKEAQLGEPGSADQYQELLKAARWVLSRFNDSNPAYFATPLETEVAGDDDNKIVRLGFMLQQKDEDDSLSHLYMSRSGAIVTENDKSSEMEPVRGFVQVDSEANMPMVMIEGPTGPQSIQEYGFNLQANKTANDACASVAAEVYATYDGCYSAEAQADFDARLTKLGVDDKTKKYWSSYFKEYGRALTKDVPRKKHKAQSSYVAYIKEEDGKYHVKSESNSNWSGGYYDSKSEAEDRLKQVEMFKHMSMTACRDHGLDITPFHIWSSIDLSLTLHDNLGKLSKQAAFWDKGYGPKTKTDPEIGRIVETAQWAMDVAKEDPKMYDAMYKLIHDFLAKHPNFLRDRLKTNVLDPKSAGYTLVYALRESPKSLRQFRKHINKFYKQWEKNQYKQLQQEGKQWRQEKRQPKVERGEDPTQLGEEPPFDIEDETSNEKMDQQPVQEAQSPQEVEEAELPPEAVETLPPEHVVVTKEDDEEYVQPTMTGTMPGKMEYTSMKKQSDAAPGPTSHNAPGKDDKKDYDHKDHETQPSKHRTRFKITKMYSTTSSEDNGYVFMDIGWDPDEMKGMHPRNIQNAIVSYVKGLESDKYYHDFGIMGKPKIIDMDADAGVARVKVRCSETRGVMTLTYGTDFEKTGPVPTYGIR